MHVIGVHGRAQRFAFRPDPFFENCGELSVRGAGKAGEWPRGIRPRLNRGHRPDPNAGAVQPCIGLQIAAPVSRRVTLAAHGYVFHQILPAPDFSTLRRRSTLRIGGTPRPEEKESGSTDANDTNSR